MSFWTLRSALLCAATMTGVWSGQAFADGAAPLEEVVVTAQRRVETLQEVPIAISVVTGQTLEQGDIHRQEELFRQIPSVSISPFSSAQAYIGIRGAVSYDDGAAMDGSVAVYVDDVYMSRLSMTVFELFDLERVEVLRGPQGTLFGRNSIGGAINVVSTLPNGEPGAKVRVNLGNYNRIDVGGMATGALSGPLSFKLSFSSRDRDGWITNILTGDRLRDENSQAARLHLRYNADAWDIVLTGDYSRESLADLGRVPVRNGAAPVVDWFEEVGGDWKHSASPESGFTKRRGYGVALRANRDLGDATVTSISAYRRHKAHAQKDAFGIPHLVSVNEIYDKTNQVSHEFRLVGRLGPDIDYVAGLFYLREHTDRPEYFRLAPQVVDMTHMNNVTNSYAAFGQMGWTFSDGWRLIGGARLTHETKRVKSVGQAGGGGVIYSTFETEADHSWTDFSPKLVLERTVSQDVSAYASVTKGFKSGGYGGAPGRVEDAQTPVAREKAWNVEFGLKADLLDHTLRLNAALFKTCYKDIQNARFGPPVNDVAAGIGVFQTVNVDKAIVQGIELEGAWRPVPPLTVRASYSFLDAEYKDSLFVDDVGDVISLDERRMPEAPRHKVYITATWLQPINYGTVRLSADYSYTSTVGQDLLSLETRKPAYDLVNAQFGWTSPDDRWEATLWAKNLFNETYLTTAYLLGPGDFGLYGDPRMYGVSVTWRY